MGVLLKLPLLHFGLREVHTLACLIYFWIILTGPLLLILVIQIYIARLHQVFALTIFRFHIGGLAALFAVLIII